jgi:hypothetical protein
MDAKTHGQLVVDARELKKLDQGVEEALRNFNVRNLSRSIVAFSELRKQIKTTLLDFPVAQIHDPAALEVLSQVNQNASFEADKIVSAINSRSTETVVLDRLEADDIDNLSSKLHEWFSHHDYIEGLYEIGSLIVGGRVPSPLATYLEEARQCYAFQQYNAMNALCRTVLELALQHYADRRNLLSKAIEKIGDHTEYRVCRLIRLVSNPDLRKRTQDLYCKMSTALHGSHLIDRDTARGIFKEVVAIVKDFYR